MQFGMLKMIFMEQTRAEQVVAEECLTKGFAVQRALFYSEVW
jgi:hypothetical protein